MKEYQIEKEFKKIQKQVTKLFPAVTNNVELQNFCTSLFGKRFKGVYASDKLPILLKNQSSIINTDPSDKAGKHWIALCRGSDGTMYFYDSFARDMDKIMPMIRKKFKNITFRYDTLDKEQKASEFNCGANCIAWIMMFHKFGGSNAVKI